MIDRADVQTAAGRIAGHVRRTPVLEADPGAFAPAARMWLKLEYLQHTGSFKARGATNQVLAAAERGELSEAGVVVASGGNAALAVAYAARIADVPARVFVPETAPPVKVAKLRAAGATVEQVGTRYAQAAEAAAKSSAETGAVLCHAYDRPEMCAGAGTIGVELLEQTGGEVDTVLLAVGGGGLLAGVAAALEGSALEGSAREGSAFEGSARVVGVEPVNAPTLHAALEAGGPVDVRVSGVAADSLGASRAGEIAYVVAARTGARSVLVDDEAIVAARRLLWDDYRVAVEHGTAAAIAALMTGTYTPAPDERVAVVICGANTDPADLV